MQMLVTGGAGYIGSVVASHLLRQGHEVVILDDLSTGFRENLPLGAKFIEGDIRDIQLVRALLLENKVQAVLHFAAKLSVPESVEKPGDYYSTNVVGGLSLLEACLRSGVRHVVFSSTAAVYGDSVHLPLNEDEPRAPISPYGRSKMMMEQILDDISRAHDLRFMALRYFNVAGASSDMRQGPRQSGFTNLIREVARCALGRRDKVQIFGTDYPTADGTCIRDFIHVEDLAVAHTLAVEALLNGGESRILNCGYGHGVSVAQVIAMFKKISGHDFLVEKMARRSGDIVESVADNRRIREILRWSTKYDNLEKICQSALDWERQLPS